MKRTLHLKRTHNTPFISFPSAKKALFSLCFMGVLSLSAYAQAPGTPNVNAGPDVVMDCEEPCIDLTATFLDVGETNTYTVTSIPYDPPFPFNGLANSLNTDIDDAWSDVDTLPFDFCFFGNVETQFQVGSNGVIRFDVDPSDTGSGSNDWGFSDDLPNNIDDALAEANVFTPGHDIDPDAGTSEEIGYEVLGTAPNRVLVVAYFEVPMFFKDCNNLLATQMAVFYETTNVIDIYIQDKPVCTDWNSGNAVAGIQNHAGDTAFVPPGRNTSDSPWTATNEAWRFVPAGPSIVDFAWLDAAGTVIGTDPTINVCPEDVVTYTAQATYTNCNGDVVVVTDDVVVTGCAGSDCSTVEFEEDFGTGTGRVSTPFSPYIFNEFTQLEGGEYAITNTSTGLNSGWHVGMEDHTPDDTDGRMMFVNAANDPAFAEFYRRTIPLQPDTDHSFAFWMSTVYDIDTAICPGTGDPSNVTYRIEDATGAVLAETTTGDIDNESDPNWQEYTLNFNTGSNTDVQLVLLNNNLGECGNDFVIDDLSIISEGTPPELVTPDDLALCDENGNQTATFDLTAQTTTILNGQDPAEFNITFHLSQDDADANTGAIATPNAYVNTTNPEAIYVRVERVDNPACFSTVDFNLIVEDTIVLTVNLPESVEACSVVNIPELDATPTNSGIDMNLVTYEWTNANGDVVATSAIFTPTETGTYTVTVSYPPCSENTFTVQVIIVPDMEVTLGEDFQVCPNEPHTVTATTTEEGATYEWFLNGNLIAGETAATIEITLEPATGAQTLSVVISKEGCTATDELDITLYDVGNCVISQGLSPNGSPGDNDILDLTFLDDRTGISKLQIFNRHGLLVFEQVNYTNQWAGQTDEGTELPTGTYFYVIDLEGNDPVYGPQATGWIYLNRGTN